tara:strand:+ start:174 stop:704 length:531 start_codon:yes stop_codon:yes gene_type:complete
MQKSEFIAKIKKLAKTVYAQKSNPDTDPKDIEISKFPVIDQFPPLKKIMEDLFDFQYEPFVKDIEWVSPRPTTFRIKLVNEADFYLTYQGKNNEGKGLFIAQVAGKRYFLESLPEEQQASEAIARLLKFNYANVGKAADDLAGGDLGGDDLGGGLGDDLGGEVEAEPAIPDSVEDL